MNEVRAGVWHWQAPHPEWKPGEEWPELVSSYAIEDEGRLLLFDPLGAPDEIVERAREREVAILLTCPWHRRDARDLADWAREGMTADDIREGLRPLLDLPIELVLPTHGDPTGRDALERALS